ncbi:fasciclin-like arabinogalactan protein 3 [Senna tora]|uniref:Fasciclin-like arabinogalactan protein 3 n=1 Tax=Senna tora TaxID=362788 RepID=A0A834WRV4_9FABA|nr:fasciclin-like arabinogalactan protein 3 [Senna tora]
MLPEVELNDFRKGSQWFSMKRQHAMIVVADYLYYTKFKHHCRPNMPGGRNCYADEHYLPTFFNMIDPGGIANWSVTYVDWSEGKWHPKSFGPLDITRHLLKQISSINESRRFTSGPQLIGIEEKKNPIEKMKSINSSLLCLVLLGPLLAMPWAIEAFDITKMLAQYSEFSSFNQHLTETKLADQINSRQTITVLVFDNDAFSAISAKPSDTIKAILSTHVILDYFDQLKLTSTVESKDAQLTTLYQTTGAADKLQGFVKVGLINEGEIAFGSAVNGAPFNAKLVKSVTNQPYNISILQVTEPIVAPGIGEKPSAPAPKAQAPAASRKTVSPVSSPAGSAEDVEAPSPAGSPEEAEAPSAAASPEEAEAPSPSDAAPAKAADTASESTSSSSRIQMGFGWATVMGFGALLVAM